MARSPSQTDVPSSPNASRCCHLETSRALVYHLLLSQFCVDNRRQRNDLHLADYNLQIHPLQPRYVQIPLPAPFPLSENENQTLRS